MKLLRWMLPLLLCLIVGAAAEAGKKPKLKAKDLLLPGGYPEISEQDRALDEAGGAPAVVLLKAQEYDWEGYQFKRDRIFRRIKILAEDAIESHGSYQFRLWGDWRIKKVEARTVLPDGTVVDAGDGINQEKGESDIQIISVSFPQVQVGAILDLDIEVTSDGLSVDPWTVQEWIPVRDARLILKPPVGLRFRIFPYRLPPEKVQPDASLNMAGGKKAFVWVLEDVPPLPDLAHLPPVEDISQRLFVILQQYKDSVVFIPIAGDWKSWGERLGKSWDDWFKAGHSQLQALARQAAAGKSGPIEKAEAIRLALRDRYRVNQINRWYQEDTPDKQLAAGAGSSGSLAALTTLALRLVDVEADLVAFRRRSDGIVPVEFPVPRLMNDLMVRIPDGKGGHLFFSPAADLHVTTLPYECSGVTAFPLDGEAEALVPVPDFTAAQNKTTRLVRGSIDETGKLAATSTHTYRGVAAQLWRDRLLEKSEEDRKLEVQSELQTYMPQLTLTGLEIENLDDSAKNLVLKCSWEVEGYAQVAGKRLILNPNLFARTAVANWAPETREVDVDLEMNRELVDTLMLRLPENVKDITVPETVKYPAGEVGLFETQYGRQGQLLIAKRHARIDLFRIPARFYPELRRWFVGIAESDEKPVVIELQ